MLKIHVLNVGHGDCIVVEFPSGRVTVVDVNRSDSVDKSSLDEILSESSSDKIAVSKLLYNSGVIKYQQLISEAGYNIKLTDPVELIKRITNNKFFWRFISTHAHMDHLSGLDSIYNEVGFNYAWVLGNSFTQKLSDLSDSQKLDWAMYAKLRDGNFPQVKTIRAMEGDQGDFWQQDGIHILAPNAEILKDAAEPNATSYVLLIKYGTHKIVLGGDANVATWDYLVKKYPETLKGVTLLKASHHGRDSGYHQEAVKLMSPNLTIVSVGKKPESDASSKYRQYSKQVLSTRWYGTITVVLNKDGTGEFFTEYVRSEDNVASVR